MLFRCLLTPPLLLPLMRHAYIVAALISRYFDVTSLFSLLLMLRHAADAAAAAASALPITMRRHSLRDAMLAFAALLPLRLPMLTRQLDADDDCFRRWQDTLPLMLCRYDIFATPLMPLPPLFRLPDAMDTPLSPLIFSCFDSFLRLIIFAAVSCRC